MNEEQTIFKGTSSAVIDLGTFFLCALVFAAGLAALFLVPPPINLAAGVVAGIALLYGVWRWMLIRFRVYNVTSERIRLTTGILTRRTDEMELYRVKDVTLVEPLLMRLLGRGSIVMTTNDASTPTLELLCIRDARGLREQLRHHIELCRERKRVRLAELD